MDQSLLPCQLFKYHISLISSASPKRRAPVFSASLQVSFRTEIWHVLSHTIYTWWGDRRECAKRCEAVAVVAASQAGRNMYVTQSTVEPVWYDPLWIGHPVWKDHLQISENFHLPLIPCNLNLSGTTTFLERPLFVDI